jgi:hypothetical protein
VMSNLVFKSGLVLALGSWKLFLRAGVMMIASALVGLLVIFVL